MKRMKQLILGIALLLAIINSANGQNILKKPLPTDPKVRIGKLDNGLTYYIRENEKPEERVLLRLAVNAGSVLETDEQKGLAHFVEHMCFNGTKNFKKHELIDFLEKMGIKFGAELNAYTSFDETVYMLQVPTDQPGLIDTAFQVLEDWAHNVSFEEEEIDKERGVIVEEWRLGLGAQDRMRKQYLPVALKGSKYAERIPIGDVEIVKNCDYETLRQFYRDWYRPDLMAVVVVGDIDADDMEQKIKTHFSRLKMPENPKKRENFDIPGNKEPLIAIATDKEATYNMVQVFYKHERNIEKTLADYRGHLVRQLYNGMMMQRLSEIKQKPDAPFVVATARYVGFLGRTKDAYVSFAAAKENQIEESLETLLTEDRRVKLHGFTQTELERQKKALLSRFENAAKEAGKTESSRLASEYINHFLEAEPIPGAEKEFELAKNFLPDIRLSEINSLAKKWITDNNMVVIITAPENEELEVPTKEQVKKIIVLNKEKSPEPYIDKVSDEPLLAKKPKPSPLKKRTENKEIGYTELTFDNGAKVICKPTDFKNDEILFAAYSPGGHSIYDYETFLSANFCSNIITQSGVGQFDVTALKKKLAGATVELKPWVSTLLEGIDGNCAPKDFETLLKLNYLYFTEPRKDSIAFQTFLSQMENRTKFIKSNPMYAFRDTLIKTITQNDPRSIILPDKQQLDKIELNAAYKTYRDRFADAGDFLFFLVGNFDIEEAIPLLETYIGGLPTIDRNESWKNVEPEFPDGITNVTIHKGTEPKSEVAIAMKNSFEWNEVNMLHLNMAIKILSIKLRESMREDQGGVYGVWVKEDTQKFPEPKYSIFVSFGCSPENVDTLTNTVFREMKRLTDEGPEALDLTKAKETLIRQRELNVKKNAFWMMRLKGIYYTDNEVLSVENYKKRVNGVTEKDIQQAAKRYFNFDNYVRVVLLPEKEKGE